MAGGAPRISYMGCGGGERHQRGHIRLGQEANPGACVPAHDNMRIAGGDTRGMPSPRPEHLLPRDRAG